MEWLQARDGGFYVRTDQGNWGYAYPTSPHGDKAKRWPDAVARTMAKRIEIEAAVTSLASAIKARNEHLSKSYQLEYDAIHAELLAKYAVTDADRAKADAAGRKAAAAYLAGDSLG